MSKPYPWKAARGSGGWAVLFVVVVAIGCGTMRTSDTTRTATEQLLIARSIDDTVSRLDFHLLAGKRVYIDAQYLDGVTDKGYLISSLRQQALACGCLLQEEKKNATYVIEARAGSVGTDSNNMLIGVPQMSIPSVMPGIPGMMIPEVALAKKTNRRAVAKIAVFAYNRVSGDPIWQSGTMEAICRERNAWLCGAGPFQRGHLHKGTELDDLRITVPFLDNQGRFSNYAMSSVTQPAVWKAGPLPEDDEAVTQTKAVQAPDTPTAAHAADKSE